jgi:hypothetical protein
MSDGLVVGVGGGENWDQTFAGAGPVDSAMQIVKSITDGDPLAVFGNVAAAGLDTLGVIQSPINAVGTSAMGWLIEHLWFLDGFLDNTAGDPVAIDSATTTLHNAAVALDQIAADQFTAFESVKVYRYGVSQSKQPFEERVGPRAEQLKLQSVECLGLSEALSSAGTIVATVRGIIRDLLAEFAWWVLQQVAIATAAAPFTGGSSVATAAGQVVLSGASLANKLTAMLTKSVAELGKLSTIVKLLAEATAANAIPAFAKYADDTGDLYTPSAYTRAEQAVGPSEPLGPYQPTQVPPGPVPPPQEPCDPVQPQPARRSSSWQTSGTLDEP